MDRMEDERSPAGGDGAAPAGMPQPRRVGGRKAKKAADAARRERHRLAEERLATERAQRRADNRTTREQDATERAERQRLAAEERERIRLEEAERARRASEARAQAPPPPTPDADTEASAAARERQRQAAAQRRAERLARDRRRAEREAARRRAKEEARKAERDAVRARAREADPYLVLGVAPDTTDEEVDRTYRRLARAHHPDLHLHSTPQDRAAHEAQMKRINAAYAILGDAQRRNAYDRLRRKA